MRIAEIVGDAYAGGWMDVLLAGFKARGHEVILILPGEGPLADRARTMGISVQLLPLPKPIRNVCKTAAYLIKLAYRLRQCRAEVAHVHLFPVPLARVAAWCGRVPVRATQWPGPAPLEFSNLRKLDTATAWMDTALIGGCQWTANHYRRQRLTRHKAFCVHYAFDLAPFDPTLDGRPIRDEFGIPHEALVISLIAYLYPPLSPAMLRQAPHLDGGGLKGHEILLQAVRQVLTGRPDAYFLIVGDGLKPEERGAYPAALRRMAVELGLGNRVIFTGFRKDIPQILAAVDIPVVPSLTENLGGAAEPLLMEKPVVASHVGGLPDLVINDETGFTVPPRDPGALAAAILRLAALSPETRRIWGRRGRQKTIELCAPERCVMALEQIFENQLHRRPRNV